MARTNQSRGSTLLIVDEQLAPRKRGRPRKIPAVEDTVKVEEGRKESGEEEADRKSSEAEGEEEEEGLGKTAAAAATESEQRRMGSSKRRTRRKSQKPHKSI